MIGETVRSPTDENIRLNSDFPKFPDTVLGRFGLHLGRLDNQGQVHKQGVFPAMVMAVLTDCLQKRQGFDVPYCPADLHDTDVNPFGRFFDLSLDFINHMRHHLNRSTKVFSFSFLADDRIVNLTCGGIVFPTENRTGKTFVMPQVQVGFRTILRNENLTVLERIHGSRIDIDVGI